MPISYMIGRSVEKLCISHAKIIRKATSLIVAHRENEHDPTNHVQLLGEQASFVWFEHGPEAS